MLDKERKMRQLLVNISNIDGAIIFDLEGHLRAYGLILDGLAVQTGNRARGSRFNSAKTFIDYYGSRKLTGIQYFAFVLSEDGDIDCMP